MYEMILSVWKENIRVDSQGYAQDTEIPMKDWGFSLHDIKTDVYLWQGEADTNVPVAWANLLINQTPNCNPTIYANEGHFALLAHWKEILDVMANG